MSEKNSLPASPAIKTAPASVSGVPTGSGATSPVAGGNAPGAPARLVATSPASASVIKAGGNKGGRPRADGLVPGSPEAIAEDRRKEAERSAKRREVAKVRELQENPYRLSPSDAPAPGATATQIPVTDGQPSLEAVDWRPEDFNQVAVDSVELAEAWNINRHVKRRVDGGLAPSVVALAQSECAFPPGTKKSLQSSSPAGLAKLFNTLHVPIAFKPFISTFPALTYLVVRDFQICAREDDLIAKVAAERKATEAPPAEPKP